MDFETEEIGRVTVLTIQGKLTVEHGAMSLPSAVRELVEKGREQVILDLGNVEFMDSLGLEALLAVNNAVRDRGGKLALAGLNPRIRHLLEITRLADVLETHDDRRAAISSLTQPSLR